MQDKFRTSLSLLLTLLEKILRSKTYSVGKLDRGEVTAKEADGLTIESKTNLSLY